MFYKEWKLMMCLIVWIRIVVSKMKNTNAQNILWQTAVEAF